MQLRSRINVWNLISTIMMIILEKNCDDFLNKNLILEIWGKLFQWSIRYMFYLVNDDI